MASSMYGAGAIGSLTGAYLANAGEDMLMVDHQFRGGLGGSQAHRTGHTPARLA
jgi:hypothetical protein